jgi:triphosphatase
MLSTSREFELKLLFPLDKLKAIENLIISKGGLRRQHLQAYYLDTPDYLLARKGIALRIRKEGRDWVQTLKISTSNPLDRIEHNVILGTFGDTPPSLDLKLHDSHEAGKFLNTLITKQDLKSLVFCFKTDIWRRKCSVRSRLGAVEFSLDIGVISANQGNEPVETRVCELEIELIDGEFSAVLTQANIFIKKFKAFIDTQSKSQRGFLLARGVDSPAPTRAKSISLKGICKASGVRDRLIHSCLEQILSNQSALNSSLSDYSEHLHQLRVGLRRLKVLLKYLAKQDIFLNDESLTRFKIVFDALGHYRDSNYVISVLNPILNSLGGPEIKLGSIENLSNPSHITKANPFQLLLIELMQLESCSPQKISGELDDRFIDEGASSFKKMAFKNLDNALRFLRSQYSRFSELHDEEIHTLRKKMKFLRYSLEFFKDYCSRRRYQKFFKSISIALDHYGLFNDICVSIARIEGLTQADPTLLFAMGWLKAERERVKSLCMKSLANVVRESPAWKS